MTKSMQTPTDPKLNPKDATKKEKKSNDTLKLDKLRDVFHQSAIVSFTNTAKRTPHTYSLAPVLRDKRNNRTAERDVLVLDRVVVLAGNAAPVDSPELEESLLLGDRDGGRRRAGAVDGRMLGRGGRSHHG